MSNSVLKETLGSDRSMIEGGSTIVSASSRRRAPRCPVCSRRYGGYDRPRRLPVLPRVRAPARGVPEYGVRAETVPWAHSATSRFASAFED